MLPGRRHSDIRTFVLAGVANMMKESVKMVKEENILLLSSSPESPLDDHLLNSESF